MSDDQLVILAAILANPDDDTARLVYADWLEEHAEPERAEFIRVQCELARDDDPHGDRYWDGQLGEGPESYRRRKALRRRERELLDEHWSEWIRGAGLVPDGWKLSTDGDSFHVWRDEPFDDGLRFQFRRGFVSHVSLTLAALVGGPCGRCGLQRVLNPNLSRPRDVSGCKLCDGTGRTPGVAPALFAAQPVTRVTLTDREPEWDDTPPEWVRADDDLNDHGRPYALPPELFDLLTGGKVWIDSVTWMRFPTRDAALTALSQACVAYGRSVVKNCWHGVCEACKGAKRTDYWGPCPNCIGTGKRRGLPPL